jgi:uncharacterized protein YjiS (DUF1127 family)
MSKSTYSEALAAFEEVARYDVSTCSDTPIVIVRHGFAGNDATCDDPAISANDTEPWARHALAANGFGGPAITDMQSTSHQQYQAARTHRSFILRRIIIAAIDAVAAFARRAHARRQQKQQAGAIYDALRELDDRTLHDLGFDRSEITSVAAEVTGRAEPARVRALLMSHTLP